MKAAENISAGVAGSVALNLLHEGARHLFGNAPHIHEVGEEAISKTARFAGLNPPKGNALYAVTLASDLLSNSLYYSMIGSAKKKNLLLLGASYGLAAGLGALTLTRPMGLDDEPVNRTTTTKLLTVAWYLAGGIVTALVIKGLRK
ncbi:hypothetical protein [Dyadobacter sandarakinus]|uniref:Uncharacterized protein n=1 Tax=Dyadobacter sandarakinus TaxID=2747268 RepID=A0ABX7IAE4_9BACT|nr:hypothetical protein [Dyadobacter sandarakinus]QRR03069.1 hypothetical protein HWI92_20215 [Dyadobacter sandarakinus]